MGSDWLWMQGFFCGLIKMTPNWLWQWLHNSVHTQKPLNCIQFKGVTCIICEPYLNKAVNNLKTKIRSTTTYLQGFLEAEGPQVDEREGILDPVDKVPPTLASVPDVTLLVWKLKSTFESSYKLSKRRKNKFKSKLSKYLEKHKTQHCLHCPMEIPQGRTSLSASGNTFQIPV